MSHPKEWDEEEDNFDLTLSQRTEELYRIPNREPDEEGMIQAAVLPLRDLVIFPRFTDLCRARGIVAGCAGSPAQGTDRDRSDAA
jgi:hypothetical protein